MTKHWLLLPTGDYPKNKSVGYLLKGSIWMSFSGKQWKRGEKEENERQREMEKGGETERSGERHWDLENSESRSWPFQRSSNNGNWGVKDRKMVAIEMVRWIVWDVFFFFVSDRCFRDSWDQFSLFSDYFEISFSFSLKRNGFRSFRRKYLTFH